MAEAIACGWSLANAKDLSLKTRLWCLYKLPPLPTAPANAPNAAALHATSPRRQSSRSAAQPNAQARRRLSDAALCPQQIPKNAEPPPLTSPGSHFVGGCRAGAGPATTEVCSRTRIGAWDQKVRPLPCIQSIYNECFACQFEQCFSNVLLQIGWSRAEGVPYLWRFVRDSTHDLT